MAIATLETRQTRASRQNELNLGLGSLSSLCASDWLTIVLVDISV